MNPIKVVLTGGPCAGKTTILESIQSHYSKRGLKVFIVPEAATTLLNNGSSRNSPKELHRFQENILELQDTNEKTFLKEALKYDQSLIIYDRGMMDGKAFYPEPNWTHLLKAHHFAELELKNRYDAVIHLETTALRQGYTLKTNQARIETPQQAIEADNRLKSAWLGTPKLKVIEATNYFTEKEIRVFEYIDKLLQDKPLEIERKFLVERPIEWPVDYSSFYIRQYYLNSSERIRMKFDMDTCICSSCKKTPVSEGVNIEIEKPLSSITYDDLVKTMPSNTPTILKRRLCFLWGNQYFEFDDFLEPKTLTMLEIELESIGDNIHLPNFLEIDREVTGQKEYLNYSIAHNSQ